MFSTVFLIVWFTCGLIAGLAFYRYFESEFPSQADRDRPMIILGALAWFIGGPWTLLLAWAFGNFKHGINPFRKP